MANLCQKQLPRRDRRFVRCMVVGCRVSCVCRKRQHRPGDGKGGGPRWRNWWVSMGINGYHTSVSYEGIIPMGIESRFTSRDDNQRLHGT